MLQTAILRTKDLGKIQKSKTWAEKKLSTKQDFWNYITEIIILSVQLTLILDLPDVPSETTHSEHLAFQLPEWRGLLNV